MNLTALTSRTAAAVVAAVAGVISYGHIRAVATRVGESDLAGWLLPLSVDGLVVVGTLALLEDKRQRRHPRMSARVAVALGVATTIAFNIGSAEPNWTARLVAAVPAASFLVAVEVLSRTGKRREDKPFGDVPPAYVPSREHALSSDTPAVAVDSAGKIPAAPRPPAARRGAGRPSAAERIQRAHDAAPTASNVEIAAALGLSADTVRRHRKASSAGKTPDSSEVDGRQPALVG